MNHIHEEWTPENEMERRSLELLGVRVCRCGEERIKGRWRSPRTMTGFILRARWNPEEEA